MLIIEFNLAAGQQIKSGDVTLTRGQSPVAHRVTEGLLNKEISNKLGIAEATVKYHVARIASHLGGFKNRTALAAQIAKDYHNSIFVYRNATFGERQEIKSLEELTQNLKPKQKEIFDLVAQGLSNKDLSTELGISQKVAQSRLCTILRKTGCSNRTKIAVAMNVLSAKEKAMGADIGAIVSERVVDAPLVESSPILKAYN